MNKRIEQEIQKIYKEVFKKVFNECIKKKTIQKSDFEKLAVKLGNSDKYKQFAKEFAIKLSKQGLNKQKGIWKKYFEAAKASNHIAMTMTFTKFQEKILRKTIVHNFEMIKSIPQAVKKLYQYDYSTTLINAVVKGKLGRNAFRKQLEAHGHKNAKVIARTETAKLQSFITENSATQLGSVAYRWVSSHDRRTRPSHKAMNNVVVFFRQNEEKPKLDNMYGNAGEFPNCRCDLRIIFDERDLKNNFYQVYDYRVHKIIEMSKKELLDALEKGEL